MDNVIIKIPAVVLQKITSNFFNINTMVKFRLQNDPFWGWSSIDEIRKNSLNYCSSMRLMSNGEFYGYRHSSSTTKPVLYDTVAALLLKHLYNIHDKETQNELAFIKKFQCEDGLFRDPAISCEIAEKEDWWGWRHLTLHALMVLAVYNSLPHHYIHYIEPYTDEEYLTKYLDKFDWGRNVANTSNAVQNIGVMLQYVRDYQGCVKADSALDLLYEYIDLKQDISTGLFGNSFKTPYELSQGVQAGYHFWLLYFYDRKPIHHQEKIIDNLLKTQNVLGGYGTKLNSSACEDIDSIDPLIRFTRIIDYRHRDIQKSLQRAFKAVMYNLNPNGSFVFRRHEDLTVVHSQMYSRVNEGNLFYTWFRSLSLAYLLTYLDEKPTAFEYEWQLKHVLGHQFI